MMITKAIKFCLHRPVAVLSTGTAGYGYYKYHQAMHSLSTKLEDTIKPVTKCLERWGLKEKQKKSDLTDSITSCMREVIAIFPSSREEYGPGFDFLPAVYSALLFTAPLIPSQMKLLDQKIRQYLESVKEEIKRKKS